MKYPPELQGSTAAPHFDGTQACLDASLDLFFPDRGHHARDAIAEAKKLCDACRFLAPCLHYALTPQGSPARYVAGVWGHTTEAERTAIRRRLRHRDLVGIAS